MMLATCDIANKAFICVKVLGTDLHLMLETVLAIFSIDQASAHGETYLQSFRFQISQSKPS